MPEIEKPILDPNLPLEEREEQAIRLYFELYRQGRFYECHDVMEEIWFETEPSRKPFFQGLLQCAVCRHHWENGNRNGAAFLYRKGVQKLLRFCPSYGGVDLDAFLRDLSEALPRDLVESSNLTLNPSPQCGEGLPFAPPLHDMERGQGG